MQPVVFLRTLNLCYSNRCLLQSTSSAMPQVIKKFFKEKSNTICNLCFTTCNAMSWVAVENCKVHFKILSFDIHVHRTCSIIRECSLEATKRQNRATSIPRASSYYVGAESSQLFADSFPLKPNELELKPSRLFLTRRVALLNFLVVTENFYHTKFYRTTNFHGFSISVLLFSSVKCGAHS